MRARQEKVPFATLDDAALQESQVRPLLGRHVALDVGTDGVVLREATPAEVAAAAAPAGNGNGNSAPAPPAATAAPVSRVNAPRVVALGDAVPTLCGAKAAACGRLDQVRDGGHACNWPGLPRTSRPTWHFPAPVCCTLPTRGALRPPC